MQKFFLEDIVKKSDNMDSLALNGNERESGCYACAYVHPSCTSHSFYRLASQATCHIVHGMGSHIITDHMCPM
jgi:hypothetical protein